VVAKLPSLIVTVWHRVLDVWTLELVAAVRVVPPMTFVSGIKVSVGSDVGTK
jgi:hypothetical protein